MQLSLSSTLQTQSTAYSNMSICMINKLLNFNMSKTEFLVFPDKSFPPTVIPISVKKQFHPYCSGKNPESSLIFLLFPPHIIHQQFLSAIFSMNIQNQTLSYALHYNPNYHHCLNILTDSYHSSASPKASHFIQNKIECLCYDL